MSAAVSHPDFAAIKQRQQATWAAGDYASSAPRCNSSASACAKPSTCGPASACSMSPPATATPRWPPPATAAEVTSTDYVGALLDRGKERAAAERLAVTFQQADAEALPFADGSFDVVLSTFGVMFTPNQEKAAASWPASAATAVASVSPTGRLTASSASSSRSSASMCRRPLA